MEFCHPTVIWVGRHSRQPGLMLCCAASFPFVKTHPALSLLCSPWHLYTAPINQSGLDMCDNGGSSSEAKRSSLHRVALPFSLKLTGGTRRNGCVGTEGCWQDGFQGSHCLLAFINCSVFVLLRTLEWTRGSQPLCAVLGGL